MNIFIIKNVFYNIKGSRREEEEREKGRYEKEGWRRVEGEKVRKGENFFHFFNPINNVYFKKINYIYNVNKNLDNHYIC